MGDFQSRLWQIDAARGVAIIGMVVYHFLVDLEMIFHLPIGVYRFPMVMLARIVAVMFILLVGISAAIRYEKIKKEGIKKIFVMFAKRSLYLLLWAGAITAVTFIMFRKETVVMGILHFIGMSTILIVPFLLLENKYLMIVSLFFLYLGVIIPSIKITNYWLLPFGAAPNTFSSFDYFPLFPWFGIILIGVVLGRIFIGQWPPYRNTFLAKIGQKSLLVYLVHQPILWGSLMIVSRIDI